MDDPAEAPKGSTCVSELEGAELDAAVARAVGLHGVEVRDVFDADPPQQECRYLSVQRVSTVFAPSTRWEHGGPIIDRERIATWWEKDCWNAAFGLQLDVRSAEHSVVWMNCRHLSIGPTPLIAAMRAFVAMNTPAEPQRQRA